MNGQLNFWRATRLLAALGFEPQPGSPEDFTKLLTSEMKVWIPIVQKTGFQLN